MTRKRLFGRIRRSESRGTVGYEAVMSATEGGRRTKEGRGKREEGREKREERR